MISAYEHGQNAAKHAKHVQACPFDTGTTEWREWRAGFYALAQTSLNSFYKLTIALKKPAKSSRGLGCADWVTARVTTLGELDEAMKSARASKTGAYIEIVGGKMDMRFRRRDIANAQLPGPDRRTLGKRRASRKSRISFHRFWDPARRSGIDHSHHDSHTVTSRHDRRWVALLI